MKSYINNNKIIIKNIQIVMSYVNNYVGIFQCRFQCSGRFSMQQSTCNLSNGKSYKNGTYCFNVTSIKKIKNPN